MKGGGYDDNTAAEVLRLAARLQSEAESGSPGEEMTIRDLQRMGAEIGIDPEHVLAAAVQHSAEQGRGRFTSDPDSRRCVIDRPLDDETWQEIVGILRRNFKNAGQSTQVGQAREWIAESDLGSIIANARESGGKTHLTLTVTSGPIEIATWLTALFLSLPVLIVTAGKLGPAYGPWLAALACLFWVLSFSGAAVGVSRWGRKVRQKRLAAAAGQIASLTLPLPTESLTTAEPSHQSVANDPLELSN